MIIRKPYAFLIKNFKKIHIFLLLLCCYIYYKNMQTRSFVTEFLQLGTYDSYNEPITRHINFLVILGLLAVIALSIGLVVLLKHKRKPWKLYLVPVVSYIFMFVVFIVAIAFFNTYEDGTGTTGIRAISDLLFISAIPQYVVMIILLMRIFGVDLNKFDFKSDEEYLELDNEDREEIEINIDIDKESFKRTFRRLTRNIGYFYQEHKFFLNIIFTVFFVGLLSYSYYFVFVVHKSYREGDSINSSGYTITVKNSYYTDKDYNGNIISKDSSFVIVDFNIKNNVQRRDINFNRFHIMNRTHNYSTTFKTYDLDFHDLGKTYDAKTIENGESFDLIMVFKVDKSLNKDKFVLYYQELDGAEPYLRKIKLNITDLSEIKKEKVTTIKDVQEIEIGGNQKSFAIESIEFNDMFQYSYQNCTSSGGCYAASEVVKAPIGKKILKVDFISDEFEGKDFVDFSAKYGKIVYINSKGSTQKIPMEDAINRKYNGKYLYLKIPADLEAASVIRFEYTLRDHQYRYRVK